MEKMEFRLDTVGKPPKIIVFTPHERFISLCGMKWYGAH
jgi:hypothetical protein